MAKTNAKTPHFRRKYYQNGLAKKIQIGLVRSFENGYAEFFNEPSQPLFRLFWSFQVNISIFTSKICKKMSVQHMVLGFFPTTFRTRVSSHNY